MKVRNIVFAATAALALTACEDYTEHNFGEDKDLWQPTQVNALAVVLTDANYQDIAANADNQALALSADDNYATYDALQSVGELKYFRKGITPEEYVPAILKSLVGASQYYCMTPGSTITVTCKISQDSLAAGPAYVPATTVTDGKYLLIPQGMDQALANSNNAATETTYTYGYIYLSGTERCPGEITRINSTAIEVNDNAKKHLYTFSKEDDHFLISGPTGEYLYMDDSHNTFQYADDLGDLDEASQAWWTVTKNGDGTWDITNVYSEKVILFGSKYASAGAYADKKGTEGYLGIELYKEGSINVIVDGPAEETDVVFTLDADGWSAKSDYLNQPLTNIASTDADIIFGTYGWSFEHVGSIGDLSYVWSATTSYGIKASAYKGGTYYATDSWAISPKMNLKKAKQPVFTFQEAQKYAGSPVTDYLKVYVSTDYAGRGNQATATWTEVTDQLQAERPDGSSWDFTDQLLDLSAYAGQPNVVVAFRYISTDAVAATWEFKNVRCAEAEESAE